MILLGVPPLRVYKSNISKPVGENVDFQPQSIRENISQTVSNTATVTINHPQEVAYRLRNVSW